MNKIITCIRGGIGNQLFCYAAARRLALVNNAELVIDDVTSFIREYKYRRKYMLNKFHISARKAMLNERMEPFAKYRRGLAKFVARRQPFYLRRYLEEEGLDFDYRLLDFKIRGVVYLDGYWQSEGYFKDIEQIIREDLRIIPPEDEINQHMAEQIRQRNSVALHVRWFDAPGTEIVSHNASAIYYRCAVVEIERSVNNPHFFVFSDDSVSARSFLKLSEDQVTYVEHNCDDENAYADLWLMAQCKHFIIANSTFSWWGAWLGREEKKIVVAPNMKIDGKASWGFKGLIPREWIRI